MCISPGTFCDKTLFEIILSYVIHFELKFIFVSQYATKQQMEIKHFSHLQYYHHTIILSKWPNDIAIFVSRRDKCLFVLAFHKISLFVGWANITLWRLWFCTLVELKLFFHIKELQWLIIIIVTSGV